MQKVSDVLVKESASALIAALKAKKKTFGTAESCTGGLIAKTLTDIPGASEVFYGSVVSYDNSVKIALLGVKKETLAAVGAVSEDVARQMAEGAKARLGVDITVAVTGIAGPGGGTAEKPVGLVYIAVCDENGKTKCEKCLFDGTREEIRNATARRAMQSATEAVLN